MNNNKKIIEEIDKILKTYLARTIAVNQFGLREKLLELFARQEQEIKEEFKRMVKEKVSVVDFRNNLIWKDAKFIGEKGFTDIRIMNEFRKVKAKILKAIEEGVQ